jgi:DNA-binding winged helix-turn-helix (wHTH) protein
MTQRPLATSAEYQFGPFGLHSDGTLVQDDTYLHLPPKELQVLRVLLGAQGRLIDQDTLIEQVWPGGDVAGESLTRCIYSLRKTLGAHKHFIATVYGKGYRFQAPVRRRSDRQGMLAAKLLRRPSADLRRGLEALHRYTPHSLREACERFRHCLELDPECVTAWHGVAVALLHQAKLGRPTDTGLFREVEDALGKALACEPNNPQALVLLAFTLSMQGQHAGAEAIFELLSSRAPRAEVLYYRAWHQWCWGKFEWAREHLDASLAENPQSLGAWALRVRKTFARAPEQTLAVFEQARAASVGEHPLLLCLEAMCLAYLDRAVEGQQLLIRHRLDKPLADELGLLRGYVIARLDPQQGKQVFEAWRQAAGNPSLCPAQLSVLRVLSGDAAVLARWQQLQADPCPFQRSRLRDPRLAGLAMSVASAS